MVIVNTTFCLHREVAESVVKWMREVYLPSAVKCGAEGDELLTRIITSESAETESFALHISFPTLEKAENWNEGVGASLRRILSERWGERALTFQTYLERI